MLILHIYAESAQQSRTANHYPASVRRWQLRLLCHSHYRTFCCRWSVPTLLDHIFEQFRHTDCSTWGHINLPLFWGFVSAITKNGGSSKIMAKILYCQLARRWYNSRLNKNVQKNKTINDFEFFLFLLLWGQECKGSRPFWLTSINRPPEQPDSSSHPSASELRWVGVWSQASAFSWRLGISLFF